MEKVIKYAKQDVERKTNIAHVTLPKLKKVPTFLLLIVMVPHTLLASPHTLYPLLFTWDVWQKML